MALPLISDEIWEDIRLLLPPPPPHPAGGRPPIGDREVLTGILFVLKTGILWADLPKEMGCGCGMTCVRRLRQWQQQGIWGQMEDILKRRLRNGTRYDWLRAQRGDRELVGVSGAEFEVESEAQALTGESWVESAES